MLIGSLLVCIVLAFILSTMIGSVQEAMNPSLTSGSWVDLEHFNMFYLAATLVTNVWTYIVALVIFGLMYWAYIYVQRRSN